MTELYALPDHEVVYQLLPWLERTPLPLHDARQKVAETPGLVPVAIDHNDGGKVIWADLQDHPYREWQFIFTVEQLAKSGTIQTAFTSRMDIFLDDALFEPGFAPTGLIFHVSRCGSTLLGKALARLEENIVINQGGPLQRGFWAYLSDDWKKDLRTNDEAKRMFRNLVLAMTRPRGVGQKRSFVKFISWNTLYSDFVMKAFSDVPALFMFRDPVEVIASVKKATTAALVAKKTQQARFLTGLNEGADILDDTSYLAYCYRRYFQSIVSLQNENLSYLEYYDVTRENFEEILARGMRYKPQSEQILTMKEQFQFHSKDDGNAQKFKGDVKEKRALITLEEKSVINEICGDLLNDLRQSNKNMFSDAVKAV